MEENGCNAGCNVAVGSELAVCCAPAPAPAAAAKAAAFALPTIWPFSSYSLIGHRPLSARVQSGLGPSEDITMPGRAGGQAGGRAGTRAAALVLH